MLYAIGERDLATQHERAVFRAALLIGATVVAVQVAEIAILGGAQNSDPGPGKLILAMMCVIAGAATSWVVMSRDPPTGSTGSRVVQMPGLLFIFSSPIAKALTADFTQQLWVLGFEMVVFVAV